MAKIVSFINMKGGVGKTTSSVTLAETCASEFNWRVLLVDLDAQASASYALCGDEGYEAAVASGRTLAGYFDEVALGRRPGDLSAYVLPSERLGLHADAAGETDPVLAAATGDDGLPPAAAKIDVICSEPALRYAERALIERYYALRMKRVVTASAPEGQTRRIMRDALRRLSDDYELIVLDCPPGISVFAEAGVACSDLVVIPTIPDYLSTLGLKELNRRFLRQLRRDGNLRGRTAILPTKVEQTNATHKRYLKDLERMIRDGEVEAFLLDNFIAQSSEIARALDAQRLHSAFHDKYANVADDLREFSLEVKGLLHDASPHASETNAA